MPRKTALYVGPAPASPPADPRALRRDIRRLVRQARTRAELALIISRLVDVVESR